MCSARLAGRARASAPGAGAGARSRSAVGGRRAFANPVTTPGPGDGETVWWVTLLGEVPLKGSPAVAATAMIVHTTGRGEAHVSPFEDVLVDAGSAPAFRTAPGSTTDTDDALRVDVPDGLTVSAVLDDGDRWAVAAAYRAT